MQTDLSACWQRPLFRTCSARRYRCGRWVAALFLLTGLGSCAQAVPQESPVSSAVLETVSGAVSKAEAGEIPALPDLDPAFFEASWQRYQQRFIQGDGRVIDWETEDQRTTSEGQAYAMLRAVMIDDPEIFDRVLRWGENNLARYGPDGQLVDQLWAWKWGPKSADAWGITDENFATDADIDVAMALIVAARRWNRSDYLALAQQKLADIWTYSTVTSVSGEASVSGEPVGAVPSAESAGETSDGSSDDSSTRYLLPGPLASFSPDAETVYLNPSYFAPYAFRLFAQVDRDRDWLSLVDSSYAVLTDSADLSTQGLPSNWVALNLTDGSYQPLPAEASIQSIYGFDAYRVWWRVALDAAWFDAPEARAYLQAHLPVLVSRWQQDQAIPAEIDLDGAPLTDFESTAQYAMLYRGLVEVDADAAATLRDQKLLPTYRDGFWDSDSAYYTQNLAWLGLFPPAWVSADWLKSR